MMSDNKTLEFVIHSQSPYYFHPSDAPRVIMTALKFDGKNYELWKKVVLTALTTKNKVTFIGGTTSKPEMKKEARSTEANEWIIVNSMVTSWILNVKYLEPHASIAYADSPQTIWENIQKRYAMSIVPTIPSIKGRDCLLQSRQCRGGRVLLKVNGALE